MTDLTKTNTHEYLSLIATVLLVGTVLIFLYWTAYLHPRTDEADTSCYYMVAGEQSNPSSDKMKKLADAIAADKYISKIECNKFLRLRETDGYEQDHDSAVSALMPIKQG
jgi:hypothetical protein